MVEKVLFWGQIFEMGSLMDLHVLGSSESESHIFIGCLFFCVCVISITKNQTTAEISKLVFYNYTICRCHLNFFMKIEEKFYVQAHIKQYIKARFGKLYVNKFLRI